MDDLSKSLIDARLAHDEMREAAHQARQVERVIKHRSRKAWQAVWFHELERFREAMPLISDRLGLVWYRDRAQILLYASPPAEPLTAFRTKFAFTEYHCVGAQEGVLAWSLRHGSDLYWVHVGDPIENKMGVIFDQIPIRRLGWPNHDVPPVDPSDSAWARDAARMLQNGWTATRSPTRGFLGISHWGWTLGLWAFFGISGAYILSQMLHW